MMEKLGFLLCVWLLICGSCLGRFSVEKNCLEITAPDSLKGVWECSLGNFGLPQYRGTLRGVVVYPKTNNKACKSFDQFGISFKSKPGGSPIIVLVDRGDCYFSLKAWHAQNAGAAAVLIADDIVEPVITMDTPENIEYQITIPSAVISKSLGDKLKKSLSWNRPWNEGVSISLNWPEAHLATPSEQVEYENASPEEKVDYEFWINIQSDCGPKCHDQIEFFESFKRVAQSLEQKGYIKFTPRYMTWYCPEAFILSRQCKSQCIYHGRYCAPDPNGKFSEGYYGKDVVLQKLIQACFFKVAKESGKPWVWWDYVTEFATRCSMKDRKYNPYCAYEVIQSFGFDLGKIALCAGDPHADEENQILKAEQEAQSSQGSRGAVTMLPSLFINDRKYTGKLEKAAVLKAICAAFPEATEAGVSAECGEALEQPLSLLEDQ